MLENQTTPLFGLGVIPIMNVPGELLDEILKYLDTESLRQIRHVAKFLNDRAAFLFHNRTITCLTEPLPPISSTTGWKECVKHLKLALVVEPEYEEKWGYEFAAMLAAKLPRLRSLNIQYVGMFRNLDEDWNNTGVYHPPRGSRRTRINPSLRYIPGLKV
jgi:hypothetical protein